MGAVTEQGLLDVGRALAGTPWEAATMRGLLDGGEEAMHAVRKVVAESTGPHLEIDAVEFLPPVLDPPRIFCIGRNYEEHAKEGNADVPEFPMVFLKPWTSLIGHDQSIQVPDSTDRVDWEGEIAIVIGTAGRDVPEDRAFEHVAGYAIANDVTARDWQRRTSQFDAGKMFDTFGPLGPYLVTADEVADPDRLQVETRVNGAVMQSGTSADMVFSMAHLVSYLSRAVRLLPGDVILTGTPSGVGYARTPPVYLVPGDVVEVEVTGLGVLRNPVRALE